MGGINSVARLRRRGHWGRAGQADRRPPAHRSGLARSSPAFWTGRLTGCRAWPRSRVRHPGPPPSLRAATTPTAVDHRRAGPSPTPTARTRTLGALSGRLPPAVGGDARRVPEPFRLRLRWGNLNLLVASSAKGSARRCADRSPRKSDSRPAAAGQPPLSARVKIDAPHDIKAFPSTSLPCVFPGSSSFHNAFTSTLHYTTLHYHYYHSQTLSTSNQSHSQSSRCSSPCCSTLLWLSPSRPSPCPPGTPGSSSSGSGASRAAPRRTWGNSACTNPPLTSAPPSWAAIPSAPSAQNSSSRAMPVSVLDLSLP